MKLAFIITRKRNNVLLSFGTLKVQSFMLTEMRDCDLLIVVTSSTHVHMFIPMLYLYVHMCADIYMYVHICVHSHIYSFVVCTNKSIQRVIF